MRNGVALTKCPKSYISGESEAWVEQFLARKVIQGVPLEALPARTAEALLILENEFRKEQER